MIWVSLLPIDSIWLCTSTNYILEISADSVQNYDRIDHAHFMIIHFLQLISSGSAWKKPHYMCLCAILTKGTGGIMNGSPWKNDASYKIE